MLNYQVVESRPHYQGNWSHIYRPSNIEIWEEYSDSEDLKKPDYRDTELDKEQEGKGIEELTTYWYF